MSSGALAIFPGFTRDRERIATSWLYALLALCVTPFLLMTLRFAAVSGMGPFALAVPGDWLNHYFTLQWVGWEDRDVVVYILMLPIAALLVAFTRLTLGIRVLGFRSILIAIGMQEIGVVPCLLLIALIACTVVLVRPSMRRSGMPLFARVAVVLCVVAFTMLGGLLAGAWLDSVTLWSMAFFPVVILAMLAESVAETVARDGLAMAIWRTFTTILLAMVIAGLNQFTPLREFLLFCPEALLLPVVLTIYISEFLDLRRFENFRPADLFTRSGPVVDTIALRQPEVVIVRSRFATPSPRRIGGEVPKRYRRASLQDVIDQLRARGRKVHVLEGDCTLPAELRNLATDAFRPQRGGLCVVNFSGGAQGSSRLSQVPMVCDMLGVPCTGPEALAPVFTENHQQQRERLAAVGLHVPVSLSVPDASAELKGGDTKICVRPCRATDYGGTCVTDANRLHGAIKRVKRRFGDVICERVPVGRKFTVVLLKPENPDAVRVLPLLRRGRGQRSYKSTVQLETVDFAGVSQAAIRAAMALGCRDYARVDVYLENSQRVVVTRVLGIDPLTAKSASGVAAGLAGIALADITESAMVSAMDRAALQAPSFAVTNGDRPVTKIISERIDACVTSV